MQEIATIAINFFNLWLDILASDFLRYWFGTLLVTFVVWGLLRPWIMHRKIQSRFPPLRQIRREITYSMRTVAIFAVNGAGISIGVEHGIFRAYSEITEYGPVYFVGSVLAAILLHDAYFYWAHRAMHHPKLFKHFHRTHHRSRNPTPFTAYSFDAPEAVVMAAYMPLVLLIIPLHHAAIGIILGLMILRNGIGHCGFEVFPRRTLQSPWLNWSTTVTHHDLHHRYNRSNFGFYFSWWDKWMGTEDPEYSDTFKRVTSPEAKNRALSNANRPMA